MLKAPCSILFLLSVLLVEPSVWAQNLDPKVGFNKVYIGMSTSELVLNMGEPGTILSFEEEKEVWLRGGYDLSTKIVFFIGFDEVYNYQDDNDYGLWKAYAKDGKIVYMSVTSYSATPESMGKITIDASLKFGNSIDDVINHMGANYLRKIDELEYTEIIYPSKGIRFIFVNDELDHVYIFGTMPKSEEKKFIDQF